MTAAGTSNKRRPPEAAGQQPSGSETRTSAAHRGSRPGLVRRGLFWMAGVVRHVIERPECRVDWNRCSALGTATGAEAGLATITGALVAYSFLFNQVLIPAVLAGVAWGGLILTLDRLMLASVLKQPDASVVELVRMAAPRWFLAVLVALVVGTPAELAVFQRQLDVQVVVDHQNEVARQQERLVRRYADLPVLAARRSALAKTLADSDAEASTAFHQAQCEGEGSCGSGRPGAGPLHEEKLARFQQLQTGAERLRAQETPRLHALTQQIASRERQREEELASFERTTNGADDLLTRLLALDSLKSDPERGPIVTAAGWIIRLLTLALEILPVTMKLFTRGAYDAALLSEQDRACMRFDVERLCEEARASARLSQERTLGRAGAEATSRLARAAADAAMNSPQWRQAQKQTARDILARAVPLARRAVADVFSDEAIARDIKAGGVRARRKAEASAVEAERRRPEPPPRWRKS